VIYPFIFFNFSFLAKQLIAYLSILLGFQFFGKNKKIPNKLELFACSLKGVPCLPAGREPLFPG
jgi:hypothetical protein